MLPVSDPERRDGIENLRLATTDNYDQFLTSPAITVSAVTRSQALEESFFLGLRLNRGISLADLRARFGEDVESYSAAIDEMVAAGLLEKNAGNLRLTPRGRLLSNEVFERFIGKETSMQIG
jgi:oxygen-independent coproporphyrinogen-3 oxidase